MIPSYLDQFPISTAAMQVAPSHADRHVDGVSYVDDTLGREYALLSLVCGIMSVVRFIQHTPLSAAEVFQ